MRRLATISSMSLAAVIAVLGPAATAPGQYGGYGWGGWGGSSTVGGDVARGAGVFAAGAGQYNLNTSQARAINADTWKNMNEYMYQSIQIANQQYYAKTAAKKERRNISIQELENRHLYAPTEGDMQSGDALNAILNQLHNPAVPNSVLDNIGTDLTLTGDQIKLIPLKFAQKGVIVSLDRLSVADGWPLPLLSPEFAKARDTYMGIVNQAKELEDDQSVPDERIVEAIQTIQSMEATAKTLVGSGKLSGPDYAAAVRFLTPLAGMLQLARQPDIRKILRQAAEKKEVKLPNAVAFMEVFNLQFGAAKSPEEKALYGQALYPMLRELRDRVEKELGNKIPTATTQFRPTGQADGHSTASTAFQGVDWNTITRTAPPAEPPPVGAEDANEPAKR